MSAVLINEINHAETKAKTEVISNYISTLISLLGELF